MEFLFAFWTVNCVIALIVYLVYRAVRNTKRNNAKSTTSKGDSAPKMNYGRIDPDILKKVEYALQLVKQLKDEDEGNFINLTIQGLSNNMVVSFGAATELLIKVQYCGSSVTWAWQQASYVPYDKYKELFMLTTGQSGDYFFVANVKLEGASAVTTLNAALRNAGFAQKADSGSRSLYCSLL